MGADLWAFVVVSVLAVLLVGWMLCEAASQADDALEEWAVERALEEWRRDQERGR